MCIRDRDIVYARIDRRRKLPVTSLLFALGMDGEEILSTFYKKVTYARVKDGWSFPFDADRMKGIKAVADFIDADTGEAVSYTHLDVYKRQDFLSAIGTTRELEVKGRQPQASITP